MEFSLIIENLKLHTIIGILESERINKQEIEIKAKISYNLESNFLDYVEIKNKIVSLLQDKKFELLETALESIVSMLKNDYLNITKISLSIKKLEILDDCIVGAKIVRNFKE